MCPRCGEEGDHSFCSECKETLTTLIECVSDYKHKCDANSDHYNLNIENDVICPNTHEWYWKLCKNKKNIANLEYIKCSNIAPSFCLQILLKYGYDCDCTKKLTIRRERASDYILTLRPKLIKNANFTC